MKTGILYLLSSAFLFACATVFAKLVNIQAGIPGVEVTFFRFLIGFIAALIFLVIRKESLRPVKTRYVLLRSFLNIVAVIFFFTGIQYTTVTNANMLNMTYPVFVYLFSPFINRERRPFIYYTYLLITLSGIYLVINPDFSHILIGDSFALVSGIIAGGAISILRESRKYDRSFIIFFYLMGIGTVVNFFVMIPFFVAPAGIVILYLFLAAFLGALGQVFITIGYRHIDAASGSLVSSTRILFAGIMGVTFFADPLTAELIAGGALIIISLAGVSGGIRRLKGIYL